MGKLRYGLQPTEIEIDDQMLAHLKVVILSKFRRGECFAFTWVHGRNDGSGRTTLWMHPALPLQFVFNGDRPAELNREWVEHLLNSANTPEGMRVSAESEEAAKVKQPVAQRVG